MNVNNLVSSYGYLGVAGVVGAEALGIPFPGETVLIAAGTYAGDTHKLSPWLIWLVAVVAIEVGASLGYVVGAKGGYRLLVRYGRYIKMREPEIKVGRYVFDRYGAAVVMLGRFVGILRTYAPFLAGTSRMRWARFSLFNLVGALAWSGLWTFLAYHLGAKLSHTSSAVSLYLGIAAVLAFVAVLVVVKKQAKRLEAVAEAAFPGPLED